MTELTEERLQEIEARANAATWGPWEALSDGTVMADSEEGPLGVFVADVNKLTDAEFVADARTDIPALIAALREAREEARYFRDRLQGYAGEYGPDLDPQEILAHDAENPWLKEWDRA